MGLWLCYQRGERSADRTPTRDPGRHLNPCGKRVDSAGGGPRDAHAGPPERLGNGPSYGPLTAMIPFVASGPPAALAGEPEGRVG